VSRVPPPVRAAGGALRRALVPEWLDILRDVAVLRDDRDHLLGDVRTLRGEVGDLQAEVGRLRGELDELRGRADVLDGDMDESRRLSARVAEVTDLVTEVVLPLHDREIDASRLRPEGTEPD
jgi:predicted nuclease with TOPRIM domain